MALSRAGSLPGPPRRYTLCSSWCRFPRARGNDGNTDSDHLDVSGPSEVSRVARGEYVICRRPSRRSATRAVRSARASHATTHDANRVGAGQVFRERGSYECLLTRDSTRARSHRDRLAAAARQVRTACCIRRSRRLPLSAANITPCGRERGSGLHTLEGLSPAVHRALRRRSSSLRSSTSRSARTLLGRHIRGASSLLTPVTDLRAVSFAAAFVASLSIALLVYQCLLSVADVPRAETWPAPATLHADAARSLGPAAHRS